MSPKKNTFLKNIFSILIIFSLIFITNSTPSLDEEQKKEDEPEMVVGYISVKFKIILGMLIAPIKVDTPEQEIYVALDIGSHRTWITDLAFKKDDSLSYSDKGETESYQYDFTYSGKASTETFNLAEKRLSEFKFLLANNLQNVKMQGALSLGHEYNSKHKSFIYEMSHVCNTFYNMFLFKFDENNEGELLIGDLIDEQKRKNQYINKCLFLKGGSAEDQTKWLCEITQMFIGDIEDFSTFWDNMMEQIGYYITKTDYNKLVNINESVVFETIFDKIFVPKYTMEYLKENYLKNIADNKKMCKYNDNDGNIKITCTKEEVSKLKRLNFVLSKKTALAFPSQPLFVCGNNDKCEFLIQHDDKYSGFIFGLPVFKLYNIIFDYNDSDLIFFGKSDKYLVKIPFNPFNIGTSNLNVIIWILVDTIIFMIFGLGVIYVLRKKNRKTLLISSQI